MRLFLGIPSAGSPARPFLESLSSLVLPEGITAFERCVVTGNFIPAERDLIIEQALAWGADIVAMCDDDMVLPPHALASLCALLRSDAAAGIAGALYYSRDGVRPMVVAGWNAADTTRSWIPAFDDRTPVAVDGVGFGCVAIRATTVARLERPLFPAHVFVEHRARRVRVCDEDYLFCERVRHAGYTVLLHPGVRCGHYDRSRDSVSPPRWESVEETMHPRVVTYANGSVRLVPLDEAPPTSAREEHRQAAITYIHSEYAVE